MKQLTRLLASLLAFGILLVAVPFSTSAATLTSGDFSYEIGADGTATIITYNGQDVAVEIPNNLDGAIVTKIGNNAFQYCSTLQTVTFPETLCSIGASAFEGCMSLQSVTFPDSLTSIGNYAFYNCGKLKNITSTIYLYDIGVKAFHNTTWYTKAPSGFLFLGRVLYRYIGLTQDNAVIEIPDYTAAIAPFAFEDQYKINKILLPVGVRVIGSSAFANCYNLTEVRIPPSVVSIGKSVFSNTGSTTVYSAKGSAAESYATENNLPFEEDASLNYLDGDMDKDGEISSSDLRIMLKAVVLSADCDHERFLSCDIVYDGKIATSDIRTWMLMTIA